MIASDFKGFLDYEGEIHCFSFAESELTIYPSVVEQQQIRFINQYDFLKFFKKNKWTKKFFIKGITDKNKGVIFYVVDNASIQNGYFKYHVDYMYIYNIDCRNGSFSDIRRLSFSGPEINYFYNISDYITEDIKLKGDTFDEFSLVLKNRNEIEFGKFRWHNYSVKIKGSWFWRKERNAYKPLEVNSLIVLELSRNCNDLLSLIELIDIQKSMMILFCYRRNITFKNIHTYTYSQNGQIIKTGDFYFFNKYDCHEEEAEKNTKHIISIDNTNNSFSKLYTLNTKGKLYLTHIRNSYFNRSNYTPDRILSILIAFDRYFKIFYPNINIQSDEFEVARQETCKFLNDKINSSKGKLKKKYKTIKNSIQKLDIGYGERLKHALSDNFDILKPFINKIYSVKKAIHIISACSERANTIRNNMAHGSMDLKIKPINVNDIKIIEILLYSMVLKYSGLDSELIKEKIKCLFNINL